MFWLEKDRIEPAEILMNLTNEYEIVGMAAMSPDQKTDNLLIIAYANETTLYIYNSTNGIWSAMNYWW